MMLIFPFYHCPKYNCSDKTWQGSIYVPKTHYISNFIRTKAKFQIPNISNLLLKIFYTKYFHGVGGKGEGGKNAFGHHIHLIAHKPA